MGWPVGTRFLDFVDNTVPGFTAAFAHALQDAIRKVYDGTQTLKALVVDGVGGAAASPTAGDISASRSVRAGRTVSGTSAPTTKTDAGELTLSCVPVGWARLDGSRALLRGVNVYAVDAGVGTGIYRVTFDRVLGSTDCAPHAQLISTSARLFTSCAVDASGVGGRVRVTVSVFDSGGVATDPSGLSLTLFGE